MKIYTMQQWATDGTLSVKMGQVVDNDVYNELLNCMPPQTMRENLLQVGEPRNHDYIGRALYDTFVKGADGWTYVGKCREGETINRIGWGEVEARRILPMEFEGIDDFNRPVFRCNYAKATIWRFGTTDVLFSSDATESDVFDKFVKMGDGLRSQFYYFGNRFGCEPSGEPLYDGDKVILYFSNGQIVF